MSPSTRAFETLGELSPDERLATLICAVVERRPEATRALVSMSSVLAVMASYLSDRDRIALSEIVRDTADSIEPHHREKVPIA